MILLGRITAKRECSEECWKSRNHLGLLQDPRTHLYRVIYTQSTYTFKVGLDFMVALLFPTKDIFDSVQNRAGLLKPNRALVTICEFVYIASKAS